MGVENFVNSTVSGKRSAKRARVLLAAKIGTPSGEVEARLRDLSRKGALVECSEELAVGTEVTFKRGSTSVPARVAWIGSQRIGLEFLTMIDEQELFVQLKPAPAVRPKSFRRPRLNEDQSERDLKLAEAWGVTVGLHISSRNF